MTRFFGTVLAAFLLSASLSQAAEINDLNVSDASNTARFPEGMAAGTVNDSARALEGILARWHTDTNCSVVTTGSANAYVWTSTETLSAYYDGLVVCFDANFTNTGTATINVSGLGAKTLLKNNDQILVAGDIEAGQKVLVVYDGTSFQVISGVATPSVAVTDADNNFTAKQTIVSTDPDAVEDLGLDLYRNSASPAANDELEPIRFKGEDSAGAETTYAKILPILDDPTDTTEDGHMRLDSMVAGTLTAGFHVGVSIYADGNTDPGAGKIDADDVLISGTSIPFQKSFTSSEQTITVASQLVLAHSLGAVPELVQLRLVNQTGELGYSIGDVVVISPATATSSASSDRGFSTVIDSTNITIRVSSGVMLLIHKTTGVGTLVTQANWKLVVKAWN